MQPTEEHVSKLVLVILSDDDAEKLMRALIARGVPATKLGSTGGFLRKGNTTLLSGVAEDEVDGVIQTIGRICQARTEYMMIPDPMLPEVSGGTAPIAVRVGGAVVFVLAVERFEKL